MGNTFKNQKHTKEQLYHVINVRWKFIIFSLKFIFFIKPHPLKPAFQLFPSVPASISKMHIPVGPIANMYEMSMDEVMLRWGSVLLVYCLNHDTIFCLFYRTPHQRWKIIQVRVCTWLLESCIRFHGWFDSSLPSATDCQLKVMGAKSTGVAGFQPMCDERGLYQAEQCFMSQCWCVSPVDGQVIPGSMRNGRASCSNAVAAGKHATLIWELSS